MSATVTPAIMSARRSPGVYLKPARRKMGRSSSGILRRVLSNAAIIYYGMDAVSSQKISSVDCNARALSISRWYATIPAYGVEFDEAFWS